MGGSANLSSAASSFGGAYAQSEATKMQGEYQQSMANINAGMAERQAADAIKRGDKDAAAYKKKIKGVIGSQRAALAAQGIDVSSGSAADIQADTAALGAQDVLQIKNNAWREAWGYKVEAQNSTSRGANAMAAARTSASATLLTGGLQAVNYGMRAAKEYKEG